MKTKQQKKRSPALSCGGLVGLPSYRVERRSDGTTCIFTGQFNVVIAEFVKGTETDAKIISEIFARAAQGQPNGAAQTRRT